MNKIYKVIFNHRLGNFVVVSELAKSCGKTQSVASEHPVSGFNPFSFLLKTLTAGILLALGTVQTVMAAESLVVSPGTTLTLLVANGGGSYSITTNNNTMSVGQIETDPNRKTTYDTSLKLNGFGILQNRYDGPNELAGVPYLSGVGLGSDVTVGNADSIAIGRAAVAESFAHDNRKGAIALGANSKATKRSAIALGWNTRAMYSGAVAIGGGGKDTSARAGWDSISLGFNMNTEGARNTVGIGSKSTAQGEGNIFLASESSLKGKNNIVIGSKSKVKGLHNPERSYEAPGAKYLGTDYQVWDDISNNVVIGAQNTVNGGDSADFTTRNAVFGSNNIINPGIKDSVVIGSGVTVAASNTVYIGSGSQANLNAGESTAGEMGMTAFTDTEFTTIFGTTKFAGSGAKDRGVVTVGKQGAERLIQYVAPGLIDEKSTDAINGSQLYQVITHSLSQLEVGTDANGKSDSKITLKPDSYRFDIVGQNGVTTKLDIKTTKTDDGKEKKINVVNVGLQKATLNVATDENGKVNVTSTNTDSGNTGDSYATAGSVATAINNAIAQTTQQYQGDNNSGTDAVTIKRTPSQVLQVTGGITDKTLVSDNANIGVFADKDKGTLLLRLAKSLNLGNDGQLTIGNTVINKDGVTADKVTAGTTTTNSLVVKDKPAAGATDAKEVDISAGQITFKDNTGSTDSTFKSLVLSTTQKGDLELGKTSTEPSTRLVFDNKQLATTNDGLSFRGDLLSGMKDNIINRKLNEQLVLKGGYGGETSGLTSGNIGIVKSKDTDNTELFNVQLSKDISQMNSIAFGDAGVVKQMHLIPVRI